MYLIEPEELSFTSQYLSKYCKSIVQVILVQAVPSCLQEIFDEFMKINWPNQSYLSVR